MFYGYQDGTGFRMMDRERAHERSLGGWRWRWYRMVTMRDPRVLWNR